MAMGEENLLAALADHLTGGFVVRLENPPKLTSRLRPEYGPNDRSTPEEKQRVRTLTGMGHTKTWEKWDKNGIKDETKGPWDPPAV